MSYLPSLECLCVKAAQGFITASTSIDGAKLTCNGAALRANISAVGSISSPSSDKPKIVRLRTSPVSLVGNFNIGHRIQIVESNIPSIPGGGDSLPPSNGGDSSTTVSYFSYGATLSAALASFNSDLKFQSELKAKPKANYSVRQGIIGEFSIANSTEKLAGSFANFQCLQKLYPIADINVDNIGRFTDKNNQITNLYENINEGVFTGDYHIHGGLSTLIADDVNTYIQPSAIHSEGLFQYKCEVTKPIVRPEDSRFRIRASSPISNYESRIPPKYTIHEIRFSDPSGNLMIEYDDIVVRGDNNFNDITNLNFGVYSSKPKINNVTNRYEWQSGFPLIHEANGYTLSFKINAEVYDDAFNDGFNLGFEENSIIYNSSSDDDDYLSLDGSPLSTQTQRLFNPTHSIRISALEICNSGGIGPRVENYVNLYAPVRDRGHRIQRIIYPSLVKLNSFDTGIWPLASSIWTNELSYTNTSENSTKLLTASITNDRPESYIELTSSTLANSGKLSVRLGHTSTDFYNQVTDGAFAFGFDESIYGKWTQPFGAFNTQNKTAMQTVDSFFVVESVSLRVLAKKAIGSVNYALDVVGYSDDKLLAVTSAVGGFLQNISGTGDYPVSSGFNNPDDFALAGTSVSEKDGFFKASGNNAGFDHYSLSTTPLVTGTDFAWYEIPLKVYEDKVRLGKSRDYSMSSLFEKLYLDIFPIPSGARIASVQLLVNYAPQNALNLITEGGEKIRKVDGDRHEIKFYPTARGSNDLIINAGPHYAPISKIENIPHAFTTPNTIKSNYSRRWRGMEGTVNGPFDPDMFDFGYENPLLDFPFLSGFYDFDYDSGTSIIPRVGNLTGVLTTTYPNYRFKNLGWRFQNNTLFTNKLPGYTGAYQTTDWTSLANGPTNFQSHPLYGHIADAFNNAVRISGHNSYINFGDVGITNEFSLYLRFSPDSDVSGVGYDLFESGVLASKWQTGNSLEFALGYASGYLRATAKDAGGTIHIVQDSTHYTGYQYPLSVILTYNDHNSSGLKLYTDNEFQNNWTTLRASSVASFELANGNSQLIIGNSTGSGVGFNMFVNEFGLSNKANIVYSNPDLTLKEVTAQTFLENNRVKWWGDPNTDTYVNDSYKLWDNVNEDTYVDWTIGDFKHCPFGPAFNRLTKRTGRDLISFNIVHNGSGYIQNANLAMPPTIDSGVAYHTQIENDFLRFSLSDTADRFYSVLRRISKDLPRGYKFAERALVVETVIEHETTNDIVWKDGNIGPKLIVSLYTKNKEPYWTPDEANWGLINRKIHHIEPSSCMMKLSSTFDYDSLTDESEQWALFPVEPRLREFKETYFSQDVDDMFVQYDLVYPSGPAFKSRLNIHSIHTRAENAYVSASGYDNHVNLISSGGYPKSASLNLTTNAVLGFSSGTLYLCTSGRLPIQDSSNLYMTTSGGHPFDENLSLFIISTEKVSSGCNLFVDGQVFNPIDASGQLNLITLGNGIVTSSGGNYLGMSLTMLNDQVSNIPGDQFLNLFTHAHSTISGVKGIIRNNLPIYLAQDHYSQSGYASGSLNLVSLGSSALISRYPNGSMNLHIFSNKPDSRLNLTLFGDNYPLHTLENTLNLMTANYLGFGSTYTRWFNNNYGTDIDLEDNPLASIPAGDEIRGVDLIGYGSCTGDSSRKAIDHAVITHDTVWRSETCNDGGIFRAIKTYTNPGVGYSGNFYGIRKYENLLPNAAYNVEMKITTGSTESIQLPREWEEWEYGTNSTINYSGIKLIGDYPSLTGNNEIATISGRMPNDNYGRKVVAKGNLVAIGSPFHKIPDETGVMINNAGSVFVYDRNEDIAGQKANWSFKQQLMLPSGYRKDYVAKTLDKFLCYPDSTNPDFCIEAQQWAIGQEGREFGHSLDIASSGDTETIVIGAPNASWNRVFNSVVTSGIPVCMAVFTDEFTYNEREISKIKQVADKWDILYKYFSAPWNAGINEFQAQIDIKLIICQIVGSTDARPFVDIKEDWLYHTYITKLNDKAFIGSGQYLLNSMTSGIQEVFFKAFPHSNILHSGIPPIVGIFEDASYSNSNGVGTRQGINEFKNFYYNYSHNSGVLNPIGMIASSGYINSISSTSSSSWSSSSITLLNATLATGHLIQYDALKFITSGIGQEWAKGNVDEFQISPPSGGRVYVFEKENGIFNLIQEIKSNGADQYTYKTNDRFGHSVSISNNSEVIVIGSPYAPAGDSVQIYQKDYKEKEKIHNVVKFDEWLVANQKTSERAKLTNLIAQSGETIATQTVYNEFNPSDKFKFRLDNDIKPFKKIYSYFPSLIGTWQFMSQFAGTPRLGYSTAITDDGYEVAIGAPTDSFNEFDDINVWYKNLNTWASYTNAGAVRIFQSRRYYPHNKVVEFYKFGNLDRSIHKVEREAGYYDQMGLYFDPVDIPFERTKFSDLQIPQDAGLAFIITPELDAASDEIIQNIKDWLALGNRNLVLVGNDPIYEENGLYLKSNKIINKILDKLGSRMRIVPARNQYESLPDCADTTEKRFNVTSAFTPDYGHSTLVSKPNMYAKGVGDIKIYLEKDKLTNLFISSPCDEDNNKCEMPIKHYGDLRAQWESSCTDKLGRKVKYKTNWPQQFGNLNPSHNCSSYPESPRPLINRPNQDIVPILTAAEWVPPKVTVIPASSGVNIECTKIYKTETITTNSTYYRFADSQIDNLAFIIKEDENSSISGNFTQFDAGRFIDPDKFYDRDAFLQAKAISYNRDAETKIRILSNDSVLAAEETINYGNGKSSTAILIASLFPEKDDCIDDNREDDEKPWGNNDQNVPFYWNVARRKCGETGHLLQIAGFTGHSSFKDAYAESVLRERMFNTDVGYDIDDIREITEGFDLNNNDLSDFNHDVIWIAKPENIISDIELQKIKRWMESGNKKIVITYNGSQRTAANVSDLCDKLGLTNKPWFSNAENKYINQNFGNDITQGITAGDAYGPCCPPDEFYASPIQILNNQNPIIGGCNINGILTKIDKVLVRPPNNMGMLGSIFQTSNEPEDDSYWIPINVPSLNNAFIHYKQDVTEKYTVIPVSWKFDAISETKFPVQEGSGYRVFIDYVSETNKEGATYSGTEVYISTKFKNATTNPDPNENANNSVYGPRLISTSTNISEKPHIDFRVPVGTTEVTLTFDTTHHRRIDDSNLGQPITSRVLSVSGCLLPIESITSTFTFDQQVEIGEECSGVPWYVPEQIITSPSGFRPIKTDNTKYCSGDIEEPSGICKEKAHQLIEDGPVIVAEEFENFSSFTNGSERSRIIVISDSTLLQGQCPNYRNEALQYNQVFIRSLYPNQPTTLLSPQDYQSTEPGRQFKFVQKIVGPERGSVAKFYAASGLGGLTSRYGQPVLNGVLGNLNNYTDKENSYDPADVLRPKEPESGEQIKAEIETFEQQIIPAFGVFPRYSGIINGETCLDPSIGGGLPKVFELTGRDYIDFDTKLPSGFPGDLFGYSVSLHNEKLIVGSPFNGYLGTGIISWSGVQVSGAINTMKLSNNGGAGAAFYYERTEHGKNVITEMLPWEFKQKIKPSSINVGIDNCTVSQLTQERGTHNLNGNFVIDNAIYTDQFGCDVSIDADILAVGAPCHSFENVHEHIYTSGCFIRKEFNASFDIPIHKVYDLGSSGVRIDQFGSTSGKMVLNNGAVFTFLHKMIDWENRTKKWTYAEKLVAQGYNSREQKSIINSGCENDFFGSSVSLHRARRGDGDYTLVVGASKHDFATSGNHFSSQPMFEAGAAYTYDAMLRDQVPAIPSDQTYITASVFGHKNPDIEDRVHLSVTQNKTGNSISYTTSGIIFSDQNGSIFLEASGFDPATRGFVAHRPYVEYVIGEDINGTPVRGFLNLTTDGKPIENSGKMNLSILGTGDPNVYNNMGLFVDSWNKNNSGIMNLHTYGTAPIGVSGTLNIVMSGSDSINNELIPLNMGIRGK